MRKIEFPLELSFKIATFANDFVAKDATGHTVYYVRQKMFKIFPRQKGVIDPALAGLIDRLDLPRRRHMATYQRAVAAEFRQSERDRKLDGFYRAVAARS